MFSFLQHEVTTRDEEEENAPEVSIIETSLDASGTVEIKPPPSINDAPSETNSSCPPDNVSEVCLYCYTHTHISRSFRLTRNGQHIHSSATGPIVNLLKPNMNAVTAHSSVLELNKD